MNFHTVFDASQHDFWNTSYNIFFILPVVGALVIFFPDLMQRLMPRGVQGAARTLLGWILLVAPLVLGGYVLTTNYERYRSVQDDLKLGHFQVTVGPVTNFVPMPYEGHAMESFTVRGRTFTYSDYVLTPGFHQTASHGGPISAGKNVRVSYVGNLILKLEVADN